MNDAVQPLLILGALKKLNSTTNHAEERGLKLLIKKLINGEINPTTYQMLVNWTIKGIVVHQQKIIVETHWGNIELERRKLNGRYKLPKYKWTCNEHDYKLVYYFGDIKSIKKERLLLDNGTFNVYMGQN